MLAAEVAGFVTDILLLHIFTEKYLQVIKGVQGALAEILCTFA